MKKKVLSVIFSVAVVLSLAACVSKGAASSETTSVQAVDLIQETEQTEQTQQAQEIEQTEVTEQESVAQPADETKRADGERFESTIMIEGMEEPVQYEHIVNDTIGFEMDYDYESFNRSGDSSRECFVSVYDDANAPSNYLEIEYRDQSVEGAATVIGEELSKKYTIDKASYDLEKAGTCTRIDASADLSGTNMPEILQMVYIIPAGEGCIVATSHYDIEAAEGFGRRFSSMLHTLTVSGNNQ